MIWSACRAFDSSLRESLRMTKFGEGSCFPTHSSAAADEWMGRGSTYLTC